MKVSMLLVHIIIEPLVRLDQKKRAVDAMACFSGEKGGGHVYFAKIGLLCVEN
jgi:hypothetical protein